MHVLHPRRVVGPSISNLSVKTENVIPDLAFLRHYFLGVQLFC